MFRYEQRNTGVIRFVVIMVMVVIAVLVVYLGYMWAEPRWKLKNQTTYHAQLEETVGLYILKGRVGAGGREQGMGGGG